MINMEVYGDWAIISFALVMLVGYLGITRFLIGAKSPLWIIASLGFWAIYYGIGILIFMGKGFVS